MKIMKTMKINSGVGNLFVEVFHFLQIVMLYWVFNRHVFHLRIVPLGLTQ